MFNAGPSRQTRFLNPSGTGAWSNSALHIYTGFRDYGPAVMYEFGKLWWSVGDNDPNIWNGEVLNNVYGKIIRFNLDGSSGDRRCGYRAKACDRWSIRRWP